MGKSGILTGRLEEPFMNRHPVDFRGQAYKTGSVRKDGNDGVLALTVCCFGCVVKMSTINREERKAGEVISYKQT